MGFPVRLGLTEIRENGKLRRAPFELDGTRFVWNFTDTIHTPWKDVFRMAIHPTAIIDDRAELASDVSVGPYVVIDGPVKIGSGTVIKASAVITGDTTIGERCQIFP
ncbi:MAG TPA: hypothetical protein VMM56_14495, partial [Planctomycetaceae bacterium]|nr:hypothetical protein [Planctomycetaceae bacterium]